MTTMIKAIYRNKWYPPVDPAHLSFSGKTVIVTGSSGGLGASAAEKFATQNAKRVILAVRNETKGAWFQRQIKHLASDPGCIVDVWQLDMLDYDSVRAFAGRCNAELDSLDIAVLNAGVFSTEYRQSKYGWEESLQINTLSTTLLALLLLPQLRRSRTQDYTPVLEFVSSGRHRVVHLTEEEKQDSSVKLLASFYSSGNFESGKLYRASKFFLMYAVQSIARRMQSESSDTPEVFVTSVCPGACQSDLSRGVNSAAMRAAKVVANAVFLRTAEEGSRTLLSGTTLGERGHGGFWQSDEIKEPSPLLSGVLGDALRARVWQEIMDTLEADVAISLSSL